MRKFSLDSSIVISYLKGDKAAKKALETENSRLYLPSIAEMEVKLGKKDIREFEKLETLEFDSEEVNKCIEIKEHLESKGEMINKLNMMIAAQTVTSNSTLITKDRDFQKLEDYEGFNYKTVTSQH